MQPDWPAEIHRELVAAGVTVVGYVPDAGHKRLIELCQADRSMRAVVLETMSVAVRQAGDAQTVAAHVHTAIGLAYEAQGAQAVLIAQRVIGIKTFQEQTDQ